MENLVFDDVSYLIIFSITLAKPLDDSKTGPIYITEEMSLRIHFGVSNTAPPGH